MNDENIIHLHGNKRTDTSQQVTVNEKPVDQDTVNLCERLLNLAKSGDLFHISYSYTNDAGTIVGYIGDTKYHIQAIGSLEMLKSMILNDMSGGPDDL